MPVGANLLHAIRGAIRKACEASEARALERRIAEAADIARSLGNSPEALAQWLEVSRLRSLRGAEMREQLERLDSERLQRLRQRNHNAV